MNKAEKKIAFALLFERNKTSKILSVINKQFYKKIDIYGEEYITFSCQLTEFKEFLKELPNICKKTNQEITVYGTINTDLNNQTFFNYLVDKNEIKEDEAQVLSKNSGQSIPFDLNDSISLFERKEENLCY